jgi:hypothetical protein
VVYTIILQHRLFPAPLKFCSLNHHGALFLPLTESRTIGGGPVSVESRGLLPG